MSRTITTIGIDGSDPFDRVCDALNAEIADRRLVGLDAIDASFDVCLADAVMKLHGTWDVLNRDDYYVALDGASLSCILPKV